MSGRILYRGVTAGDAHPLHPGPGGGPETTSRPPSEGQDDTESLDPRIQVELEKLNKASEDINRLELQLDEARARFRQVLTDSTQMLNVQAKKLGSCIEKARPYYDARMKAKEMQVDTQMATLRYDRACGQLAAAKEMVYLAEEGFFNKGQPFDPAWQEMLNHATIKVNDAEKERYESEVNHQQVAQLFCEAEQNVKRLQKELRRAIAKSRPYFEMKASVNQKMEEQKQYVACLESQLLTAKHLYSSTLTSLEQISDEIHQQRRENKLRDNLGQRGVGVGAESDSVSSEVQSPATCTSPIALTSNGQTMSPTQITYRERHSSFHWPRSSSYNNDYDNKIPVNGSRKSFPDNHPLSQDTKGIDSHSNVTPVSTSNHNRSQDVASHLPERSLAQPVTLSQAAPDNTVRMPVLDRNSSNSTKLHPTSSRSKVTDPPKPQYVTSSRSEVICLPQALISAYPSNKSPDTITSSCGIPPNKSCTSPSSETSSTTAQSPSLPQPPKVIMRKRSAPMIKSFNPPEHASTRFASLPPGGRLGNRSVPVVQVNVPYSSAPTSPTNPDPLSEEGQDLSNKNVQVNADLMVSIQRQKSARWTPGLRPNKYSHEDLLELASDTDSISGSMASASMLDDEQIESLMLEMGEYTHFLQQLDDKQAKRWKRMSLPVKLTQLEKDFNLADFLAEMRVSENMEDEVFCSETRAPIAEEEDMSLASVEKEL